MAENKSMEAMAEDMVVEEAINEAHNAHELREGQVPGHELSKCESVHI